MADFYVDPVSGSDSNSGTEASPFATIQHALDQYSSWPTGSHIYVKRGTTCTGGWYIHEDHLPDLGAIFSSGEWDDRSIAEQYGLVLTSYGTGKRPRVCESGSSSHFRIYADSSANGKHPTFVIRDLYFYHLEGDGNGDPVFWGLVNNAVTHFYNCTFSGIRADDGLGPFLYSDNRNSGESRPRAIVDTCELVDGRATPGAFDVPAWVEVKRSRIGGSWISHAYYHAGDSDENEYTISGHLELTEFFGCATATGLDVGYLRGSPDAGGKVESYDISGCWMHHCATEGIKVRYNSSYEYVKDVVYDNNVFSHQYNCEDDGGNARCMDFMWNQGETFRNNLFSFNLPESSAVDAEGFTIGSYQNHNVEHDVYVYNNMFIVNGRTGDGFSRVAIIDDDAIDSGVTVSVKNNVFGVVHGSNSPYYAWFLRHACTGAVVSDVDYNFYTFPDSGSPGGSLFMVTGNGYTSLADYQAAGYEPNSITGDPQLVNTITGWWSQLLPENLYTSPALSGLGKELADVPFRFRDFRIAFCWDLVCSGISGTTVEMTSDSVRSCSIMMQPDTLPYNYTGAELVNTDTDEAHVITEATESADGHLTFVVDSVFTGTTTGNLFAVRPRWLEDPVSRSAPYDIGAWEAEGYPIDWDIYNATGWAPLSVFVAATGVTSSNTAYPFRDLTFVWRFTDGTGVYRKRGGCQFHVFRTPGTGYVELTVIDVDGSHLTGETKQVVVQSADEYFSGTGTYCFSTAGDFTDAPSGSTHITASTFDEVISYVADNRRLLLHRGETFFCLGNNGFNNSNVYIGAYGEGSGLDQDFGFYDNDPVITTNDSGSYSTDPVVSIKGSNIVLQHLKGIDSASYPPSSFASVGYPPTVRSLLYDRIEASGYGTSSLGFGADGASSSSEVPVEVFLANCHLHHPGNAVVYGGAERFGVYNCYLHDGGEHSLRIMFGRGGVIDSCTLLRPPAYKHCLKLHAQESTGIFGRYSEYVAIVNNIMDLRTDWSAQVGAEDDVSDEWVRRIVLDSNVFYDGGSPVSGQVAINLGASESAVRNCILWITGADSASDLDFIELAHRGVSSVPNPDNCVVEFNSAYINTPGYPSTVGLANLYAAVSGAIVRNNILYAPSPTNVAIVRNNPAYLETGNTTGDPSYVDPDNGDLHLASGSPSIDAGAPGFFSYLDADFALRGDSPDQGAYEYSGAVLNETYSAYVTDSYSIDQSSGTVTGAFQWKYSSYSNGIDQYLGGPISDVVASGSDIDLFDTMTASQKASGAARYRCLYVYLDGSDAEDCKIWFSHSPNINLYFALEDEAQTITDEETAPTGVIWYDSDSYGSYAAGYSLGALSAGDYRAVWLRTVNQAEITGEVQLTLGFGGYLTSGSGGG